ncbi:MAG TPA: efflux RND transporter periplasmic adaptor subunit [Bryobacteraceae bacterium]|jgi:RND family efflux transporter MFP subunit|nr:efflux RND transporter periplasmic adaptor subunit [Bryobacteraceae bacterium]
MRSRRYTRFLLGVIPLVAGLLASCGNSEKVQANDPGGPGTAAVSVGVTKVGRKTLQRTLALSSELVPYQVIDVYAKESGYVKELNVDYGSHVQKDQVMATLDIPELQSQLLQDDAAIRTAQNQVTHAQNELTRVKAQYTALHLQYDRLNKVSQSKPGLVAQQEVDDAQGKDLAADAQVEASQSNLEVTQSQLESARAKREHDQVLFDYSKITAPFAGVITQRYANQGTLMQAGTNSSTQAMPLVRLSQDDRFRLVIPVPESYVHSIHEGDPVSVLVPSLNRTFPGKVARFSVDVQSDTRTMHTEVDVLNPNHTLLPGLYAQATITLEKKNNTLVVPIQAVNQGDQNTVYVVNSSNKIEVRPVTLGIQTADDAEILSGLKEGESIVISDRSGLKAGQEVQPKIIEPAGDQGQQQKK